MIACTLSNGLRAGGSFQIFLIFLSFAAHLFDARKSAFAFPTLGRTSLRRACASAMSFYVRAICLSRLAFC